MDEGVLEKACRAYCEAVGIDPDKIGYGLGQTMPVGARYELWKAQQRGIHAALKAAGCDG